MQTPSHTQIRGNSADPQPPGFRDKEKDRQQMVAAFTNAPEHPALGFQATNNLIREKIEEILKTDFTVQEDGKIRLRNGREAVPAFGAAFSNVQKLIFQADRLSEGFALFEARLAEAAKGVWGDQWINFFPAASGKDAKRLRQNLKALETFERLGGAYSGASIGVMRTLTEQLYDDANPIRNEEIKRRVIGEYIDASAAAGKPLTVAKANALALRAKPMNSVSNPRRVTSDTLFNFYYVGVDWNTRRVTIVGSIELDEESFNRAELVVDRCSRRVIREANGEYAFDHVPPYAGAIAAAVLDKQNRSPKGPGGRAPTKPLSEKPDPVQPPSADPAVVEVLDDTPEAELADEATPYTEPEPESRPAPVEDFGPAAEPDDDPLQGLFEEEEI